MNVDNGDGVRDITRAEWDALLALCNRVRADNGRIRDRALQARADAVERQRQTPEPSAFSNRRHHCRTLRSLPLDCYQATLPSTPPAE